MTRKSKREIETEVTDLEESHRTVPEAVDPIEQYFSDEYDDPPREELGEAWREALQPAGDR
jgi:hypothetical protein